MKGELESHSGDGGAVADTDCRHSAGRQKQKHQHSPFMWQPIIAHLEPEVEEKETQSDGSYTLLLHVG